MDLVLSASELVDALGEAALRAALATDPPSDADLREARAFAPARAASGACA